MVELDTDTLYGGTGNDTLKGEAGEDSLFGDAGDDTLHASTTLGLDYLDGGTDTDTVSFEDDSSAIDVDLSNTSAQNVGGTADTDVVLTNIENVVGSNQKDTITGNSSDNSLFGGAEDDTLIGNGGNDILDGGDGTGDIADYSNQSNAITVNLKTPDVDGNQVTDDGQGGADELKNIEIVSASQGNDSLTGSDNADTFLGNAGNDVVHANGGNDSIDGGSGADTIHGNAGDDTITAGDDNDEIYGEEGDDNIKAGSGDDKIIASFQASGDDVDTVNDVIDGGNDTDTIDYSGSDFDTHNIDANLGSGVVNVTGGDNDTVTTVENIIGTNNTTTGDTITGSAFSKLYKWYGRR